MSRQFKPALTQSNFPNKGIAVNNIEKLKSAGIKTVKPALLTIKFFFIVMIPVSLVVVLLDASGILFYVSRIMQPLMRIIGLPGEAALVFISSILLNIYSAIAVINTLNLEVGAVIILATMCCIAHNFLVECIVTTKTGSSVIEIIVARLVCAFGAGWLIHLIINDTVDISAEAAIEIPLGFNWEMLPRQLFAWLFDTLKLMAKIVLMIFAVMFLQKLLDEFGAMRFLGRLSSPFMRIIGLPEKCAYLWIVIELVGLAYASGILIEEVRQGAISRKEADIFNYHAVVNHSQIEDTLLFVSIGVPYIWAALPRFIAAFVVVWTRRGIEKLFNFRIAGAH